MSGQAGPCRRWLLHRAHLLRGDWHMHTVFTDGRSTVHEYCEAARAQGLQLIALTEHVRRELSYDFGAFVKQVDAARCDFPDLTILRGCEAKVLNQDGDLDVTEDVLAHCDIVLAAFHSFQNSSRYVTAVLNMLENPSVDVWAHPTLYCRKQGLVMSPIEIEKIIGRLLDQAVLLEMNGRYRLPDGQFLEAVEGAGLTHVWGSDAHHACELGRRWTGRELVEPGPRSAGRELTW